MIRKPPSVLEKNIDIIMQRYEKARGPLEIDFDPDWRSPCEIGESKIKGNSGSKIVWSPTRRNDFVDDFTGLERAIESDIHEDVKKYYGRYWSSNIPLRAPDGFVELLFIWNQADIERLIENLIGHFLACQQSGAPFSIFFACTESSSDYFLTVNNQSGAVQLELPGQQPVREVSRNLNSFLETLSVD